MTAEIAVQWRIERKGRSMTSNLRECHGHNSQTNASPGARNECDFILKDRRD